MREIQTIECKVCGGPVELYSTWASECPKCQTEYNGAGQRLAPREEWGSWDDEY